PALLERHYFRFCPDCVQHTGCALDAPGLRPAPLMIAAPPRWPRRPVKVTAGGSGRAIAEGPAPAPTAARNGWAGRTRNPAPARSLASSELAADGPKTVPEGRTFQHGESPPVYRGGSRREHRPEPSEFRPPQIHLQQTDAATRDRSSLRSSATRPPSGRWIA